MISSSSATNGISAIRSTSDLSRSLAEEAVEIESLLVLLRDEQSALRERNMEQVHAAAAAKNVKLARLGTLASIRARFQQANGLSPDNVGMEAYIARLKQPDAALVQNWRRVLAKAGEARQMNVVNGRLIAAQLRFVNGALLALKQATSQLLCYGADGQTHARAASRSLASA